MGEHTAIGWTRATWNPWQGCTKVSPGCDHCYAEAIDQRLGRDFSHVRRSAPRTWEQPLIAERRLVREGGTERLLMFTCSMSDFFHQRAAPWRKEAWEIMARTPHLTYQVLTKRPGYAVDWYKRHGWLPNVWLGASVESAKYLPRLDVLARVPAPVRFVSAEPLLGPLNLGYIIKQRPVVSWVIAGGESGPRRRPLNLDWVRAIRDGCQAAGVPFFYKQGSGSLPGMDRLLDGRTWEEMPDGFGNKVAAWPG